MVSRPFVINRDVEGGSDLREVILNVTEYDGIMENPTVEPLNRITAARHLKTWSLDSEEDYFDNNEYGIRFVMVYDRSDGTPVTINHSLKEGEATPDDYRKIMLLVSSALADLEQEGTVVRELGIHGKTAYKTWFNIQTQTINFTPV